MIKLKQTSKAATSEKIIFVSQFSSILYETYATSKKKKNSNITKKVSLKTFHLCQSLSKNDDTMCFKEKRGETVTNFGIHGF